MELEKTGKEKIYSKRKEVSRTLKNCLTNTKKQKGITLIALVVTIIVLLILAGVSINMALGNNGIFEKAKETQKIQALATEKDRLETARLAAMIDGLGTVTVDGYIKELIEEEITTEDKVTDNGDGSKTVITDNGFEVKITPTENGKDVEIEIDGDSYTGGGSSGGNSGGNTTSGNNTSGAETTTPEVKVTEISLNKTSAELEIGETLQLIATVTPTNANNTNVNWSSSNTNVATVSTSSTPSGTAITVTAKAEGITTITATAKDGSGIVKSCNITVEKATDKATELTYTWEEMNKIAKEISNNFATIKKDTEEASCTIDGKAYTVSVGDTMSLTDTSNNSYTVRILGFNHDKLTNTNAYGGTNTYAGISFEFVDFLLSSTPLNSSTSFAGGWAAMPLHATLNNGTNATYTSLANKSYIKQVEKKYIETYNDANSVTTTNDYLWLLSCSEIWDNGSTKSNYPYGYAIANESTMYNSDDTQTQYKYYAKNLGSTNFDTTADVIKKPNTSNAGWWWLRSPYSYGDGAACSVNYVGWCGTGLVTSKCGIAPGFCI